MSDLCPICHRDFNDCPHSVVEVARAEKQNDRVNRVRRLLQIPDNAPITKAMLLRVIRELS